MLACNAIEGGDNANMASPWRRRQPSSLKQLCFGVVSVNREALWNDSARADILPVSVVNTYCWIHTTFTLPRHIDKDYGRDDTKTHHAYYQWVPFVLFLQGLMFYAPHWLWKTWENGKLESIIMGLATPIMNKEERRDKIQLLVDYLCNSSHHHNFYAIKFFFCELLNIINCLFNMWFMNRFLGGMFLTYGTDVLSFTETNQEERTDPMIVIFPRVTKCSFHTYGPSGTVEIHDLMCVLALNIINEKIYVIMWFWFIVLTVISITAFIYRLLMFYVPVIRSTLLFQKPASMLHYKKVLDQNVSKKLQIGDLFLIYLLSKNMEMLSFDSLLEELFLRLNDQHIYLPDHDQSNTYKERCI
nr:innexin inx2-like [Penaeus vannamei]